MSNTELTERYLSAIKLWLPRKQQTDILAEIAEDLHAQTEDRESALGRPLTADEMVELLKQRGSPLRVASGYLPDQRLINPAMVPMYRMVLKIVLLWVLLPLFVILYLGPILASRNPGLALLDFWAHAWQSLFFTIGIVTAVFWLIDRYHSMSVDRWDPRKLPRVPRSQQQMQWYNDFAGFAFGMATAIFWGAIMWHRSAFVTPALHVVLLPIWGQIFWLMLVLVTARSLVNLYCFVRPTWSAARSWVRLALDGIDIVVPLVLLRVTNWVEIPAVGKLTVADAAKLVSLLNWGMQITLVSILVFTAVDVFQQGRLLWRAKSIHSAPMLTMS
ncbi:MAG TPA: hypothetical protein VHW09_30145 [Bryobacteraceae bacterium]|jgi:hypothetical protein|nr:hypothetical protein [Bryobacteraceae bacterium]